MTYCTQATLCPFGQLDAEGQRKKKKKQIGQPRFEFMLRSSRAASTSSAVEVRCQAKVFWEITVRAMVHAVLEMKQARRSTGEAREAGYCSAPDIDNSRLGRSERFGDPLRRDERADHVSLGKSVVSRP
jgi:hypothetical protein